MSDPSLWRDWENERLICAICIEWFNFEDLYVDEHGQRHDICCPCSEREAVAAVFLLMAGRNMVPR